MSVLLRTVEDVRADGGEVAASWRGPDPETGEPLKLKPASFPVGDVRDPQTWVSCPTVTLTGSVACGDGVVPLKAVLTGEKAASRIAAVLGVAVKGKPNRKRGGVDDAVLNGTHAAE